MSVINKMLRDLDQRQTPQPLADAKPADANLRRGTASVGKTPAAVEASARTGKGVFAAVLVLVLLLLGGAFWWWQQTSSAVAVPAARPQIGQPEPATAHSLATPLAPVPDAAVARVSAPVATDLAARNSGPTNPQTSSKPAKGAVNPVSQGEPPALVADSKQVPLKTPVPPAATAATAANTATQSGPATAIGTNVASDPQGGSARQLQAGRDALAQAQSLWNAGSHEAASELLQQAIALAERTASSSPSPANAQLLTSLAREQARMQIANGRPQAALDGLTRLESFVGQDADAWAMRGNAAQRLGHHQDSLRAYTAALQIRPNEQRWLLGAAVSQAALGQTANASEMAAKARALGPISKEVQAYLRQAGVALSEP